MNALDGRRAVVTGGTKGAGAAIVHRLRAAGAHVTAVARRPDRDGAAAADENTDARIPDIPRRGRG